MFDNNMGITGRKQDLETLFDVFRDMQTIESRLESSDREKLVQHFYETTIPVLEELQEKYLGEESIRVDIGVIRPLSEASFKAQELADRIELAVSDQLLTAIPLKDYRMPLLVLMAILYVLASGV